MATLRHCPDRKSKTTVLTPTPSCPTNREVPPSLPRGRRSWAPLPSTSIHSMRSVPTGIASQDKERPFASSLLRALRSLFAAVPKARHPPPLGPPIGYGTDSAVRRAVIFFLNHRTDRCSPPHFFVLVNGCAKKPHKQQPQDTIFGRKFCMFSLILCMHPCPSVQRKPFSRSAIRACQTRSISTHPLHDSRKHGRLAARRLSE